MHLRHPIILFLTLSVAFAGAAQEIDHTLPPSERAVFQSLKDRLIQRLALSDVKYGPDTRKGDAVHCIVTYEPRSLKDPRWKKIADEATKNIERLFESHPEDLKKLDALADKMERYEPSKLHSFVAHPLDRETLDYLHRVWVKFELYPVPAKATAEQKIEIAEKNRKLTYEVIQNIEKYHSFSMDSLASQFDAFYRARTGKTFSETLRAKGLFDRREMLKKRVDLIPLSSDHKVPFEMLTEIGVSSTDELSECARDKAQDWLTLAEKAELLFQLASAGYDLPDLLKASKECSTDLASLSPEALRAQLANLTSCKDGNCRVPSLAGLMGKGEAKDTCKAEPSKEGPKTVIPEKYVIDFLTRGMARVRAELNPLERSHHREEDMQSSHSKARWEKSVFSENQLDMLAAMTSKLIEASKKNELVLSQNEIEQLDQVLKKLKRNPHIKFSSEELSEMESLHAQIKAFGEKKGQLPPKEALQKLVSYYEDVLRSQSKRAFLLPNELKRMQELQGVLAEYEKALQPLFQQRVEIGHQALKKVEDLARDKKMQEEKEKAEKLAQGHGGHGGHSEKKENKYPETQPLYVAPIDENDPFLGAKADLTKIEKERFEKTLANHELTPNSRLLSYEQHAKNEEARYKRELSALRENARERDTNPIRYALDVLGTTLPQGCDGEILSVIGSLTTPDLVKKARVSLSHLSHQKLLDFSYLLENNPKLNAPLLPLVRDEILCRRGEKSRSNIVGRACEADRAYFFQFNTLNQKEVGNEVPVINTEGSIQWKKIFSEGGHSEPLVGKSLYQRIYRNAVTLVTAPAETFDDPKDWWLATSKISPGSWDSIKKSMGCAEFALVREQLQRMEKKAAALKDFMKENAETSAKNRQEEEKKLLERLAALEKVKTSLQQELTNRGSRHGRLIGGAKLAGASAEELLEVLALRSEHPEEGEIAARALIFPPHLWARRRMLDQALEREQKHLHKNEHEKLQEQIKQIDSLSPEELAKEWAWYQSQTHSYRQPREQRAATPFKPNWIQSWIYSEEKLFHREVLTEGPLEKMGQKRLQKILTHRSRKTVNAGTKKQQEVRNFIPFIGFIEKAETADFETFTQMVTVPLDMTEITSNVLSESRALLIEDLKQRLTRNPGKADFVERMNFILNSENQREKQRILAILHVLRSLDRAAVTADLVVSNKQVATPDSIAKSDYKASDVEEYFGSTLGIHAGEPPLDALLRFAEVAISEIALSERKVSEWKRFSYGELESGLDAIADPQRRAIWLKGKPPEYPIETGETLIEQVAGTLPTEARLKLVAMNPFLKEMLGVWIRSNNYAKKYVCAPPQPNRPPVEGMFVNFTGAPGRRVLEKPEEKRAFLQRLFIEGSPSLIAEATLNNIYRLQLFLGEIENTPEMKELEKAGLNKNQLFEIFCSNDVKNSQITPLKEKLAAIIDALAKPITTLQKSADGKTEIEVLDKNSPAYRTVQLASTLLGSLESFGAYGLKTQTREFTLDMERFTPQYTKILKVEKETVAGAEKNPALRSRLDLVKKIESYLHSMGTTLAPNTRISLLTPMGKEGGTTDGNLEGLVAAFEHLQGGGGAPEEKMKTMRSMRDLFLTPNPLSIASFLKQNQPHFLAHMSQMDANRLLRQPLISELMRNGGLSEDSQKKLMALAETRYNEVYRDTVKLMEGNEEAKKNHKETNVPLIAEALAKELTKEAALRGMENRLQSAAKKAGKTYPPKTREAQTELAILAAKEPGGKEFTTLLRTLSEQHGVAIQNQDDFTNAYHMLNNTHFLQKKVQEDLNAWMSGGVLPACLKEKAFGEALGSLSQGMEATMTDIANGRYRYMDTDTLETLLWASRDLSQMDRGTKNSPYVREILADRMTERTHSHFNAKFRYDFAQKELRETEIRLEHTANLLRQIKHSELIDEKGYWDGSGLFGYLGKVPVAEKKKLVQQYQKEKENLERRVREWRANLQQAQKESQTIDGLLGANANARTDKENRDIEIGRLSANGRFYDVFGDPGVEKTQTWSRLYAQYCLPREEWQDRYSFGRDIIGKSEISSDQRGQELAVYEALSNRQVLFERGRKLAEDLPNPSKPLVQKSIAGAHIQAYLEKHPNRQLIQNWIDEAMLLGVSEAAAKQLMDQWLREGSVVAAQRKTQQTKLFAAIDQIRGADPTSKKSTPIVKWDGFQWTLDNPLLYEGLDQNAKSHLNDLLNQFQVSHPEANHPIREYREQILVQHAESNFSSYFVSGDEAHPFAVEAIPDNESLKQGGPGFQYQVVPMEKVQGEITDLLTKIQKLIKEVAAHQQTIDICFGSLPDKVICGVKSFYQSPVGNAIKRRDEILGKELPYLISILKSFGDLPIKDDPMQNYSQASAFMAAADLMLKTFKMQAEAIVELQKTVKNVDYVATEAAVDFAAYYATAGTTALFGEVSANSAWLARAAHQYASGVRGAAMIHGLGQSFGWAMNNGLASGWQAYYAFGVNPKTWEDAMKVRGGTFPLRMKETIDPDGNGIPDYIETGRWQWARGEDAKSSALGLLRSAFLVFGPAHVLNELQPTRALLPSFLQHATNFGIAEAVTTYATSHWAHPDASWGDIHKEAVTSFARGTAYGIPWWQVASRFKGVDRLMERSPSLSSLFKRIPGSSKAVVEEGEKVFFNHPWLRWAPGAKTLKSAIKNEYSIGPALAQLAGLEGIDVAMYTYDRYTRPELAEQNPGYAGYFTGLAGHMSQGLPMNFWFLRGTGMQYAHYKANQKYQVALERLKKGEIGSVQEMIEVELFKDASQSERDAYRSEANAAQRQQQQLAVLHSIAALPVYEVYEIAKGLKASNDRTKTHSHDLDFLAAHLGVPQERVLTTLKALSESTIPGATRLPGLQRVANTEIPGSQAAVEKVTGMLPTPVRSYLANSPLAKLFPLRNAAPLSEMNTIAQAREIATRQVKADYEAGIKSEKPEDVYNAKRRLARDVSFMGPVALSKFNVNALAKTLKFDSGSPAEMNHEKTIADAMGRVLGAEGWYLIRKPSDVKGLDSKRFSEFAADLKEAEKNIRLAYLTHRRALSNPEAVKDILVGNQLKSGPAGAIRHFGSNNVISAIEKAEQEAKAIPDPQKRLEALDKLKPLLEIKQGLIDVKEYAYFKEQVDSGNPEPRYASEVARLRNEMLTQRPQSLGFLGVRMLDPSNAEDQKIITAYAKQVNVDSKFLSRAIKRHRLEVNAVDGVRSLSDLVAYERTKNRMPAPIRTR